MEHVWSHLPHLTVSVDKETHDKLMELAKGYPNSQLVIDEPSHLLDISGLDFDNQTALRQLYIEIVGGIPHGNTLDLAELTVAAREAIETVTVGLLAWQTVVNEQRKAAKFTECPKCGSHCKGVLTGIDPIHYL